MNRMNPDKTAPSFFNANDRKYPRIDANEGVPDLDRF